jgi:hypothetical protein
MWVEILSAGGLGLRPEAWHVIAGQRNARAVPDPRPAAWDFHPEPAHPERAPEGQRKRHPHVTAGELTTLSPIP